MTTDQRQEGPSTDQTGGPEARPSVESAQPGSPASENVAENLLGDQTLTTYRYLRISLIAVLLLLASAVVVTDGVEQQRLAASVGRSALGDVDLLLLLDASPSRIRGRTNGHGREHGGP